MQYLNLKFLLFNFLINVVKPFFKTFLHTLTSIFSWVSTRFLFFFKNSNYADSYWYLYNCKTLSYIKRFHIFK